MRSFSNNNIAAKCLRVPGSTGTWQGKIYKKQLWRKFFEHKINFWNLRYYFNDLQQTTFADIFEFHLNMDMV